MSKTDGTQYSRATIRAFLWTAVLKTPFWALFGMLPFILYKDLQATVLQISVLITLKPIVALFSMYWSHGIHQREDRLRSNVVWSTVLGYIPFLFVPWIASAWYYIAASGIFMLFNRGGIPAWMELLKLHVPSAKRQRIFSVGSTFCYLGGGGFPFLLGWLLDGYAGMWQWLFPASSLVAMSAVFFQLGLHKASRGQPTLREAHRPLKWQRLLQPWRLSLELMRRRPDFTRFQLGFMFGGAGLMVMQPALPVFFVDRLGISYTELAVALTLCKGIGFALTAPNWARWMNRVDIYHFSALVTLLAALFPLGLLAAKWHITWLFAAYLGYGIMQAGSELSWNLSGTIFAKNEDSSVFTGINVVMVGVRGCVAPPLGSLLLTVWGPASVLVIGGICCLLGTWALSYGRSRDRSLMAA